MRISDWSSDVCSSDLPRIPELGNLLGKAFLLPAPVLPIDRFRSLALPTPMSTAQRDLPIAAILYDADGREAARHAFGRLPRDHAALPDVDAMLDGRDLLQGYGPEIGRASCRERVCG